MWFLPSEERKKKHAAKYLYAQLWSTVRVKGFLLLYVHTGIYVGQGEGGLCASNGKRSWEKRERRWSDSGYCAL